MIIVTSHEITGRNISRSIGLVKGSTIRARNIGKDILAGFRGMVGGEITEYTKMMAEAREQALQRMEEDARSKGADAVICMRFDTAMVMQSAAEIIAYGTGVVLE
jgi:uncharacterized protein YbjQ (UPF0145 family)